MSSSGFRKNPPDTRKKCTLCNEIGHLASDCTGQPGPAPTPAPTPAPPSPPARSYASAVATPVTAAAARARFDKLVAYPLDPRSAKPNPAAASFRPRAAAPDPAVAAPVRPATTAVASHPVAASSRPTTIRPSPSAGPSNPPTTVSSPAAQGPGSFNVDLASIGIELSEEQKSWDPIKQKHEFGIRTGFGTSGKRLLKPEVITNYVKIVKRPEDVDVYELKIVHHTELDRKEWLVKDKTHKKAIFEQLKHQLGYQNLRDHQTTQRTTTSSGPRSLCSQSTKTNRPRLKPRRLSL